MIANEKIKNKSSVINEMIDNIIYESLIQIIDKFGIIKESIITSTNNIFFHEK